MSDLRSQQRRFLELRAAEKAEKQRLEEEEKRLAEEKVCIVLFCNNPRRRGRNRFRIIFFFLFLQEKRMAEYEAALKLQKETEERVAAAMLSESYIADLVPNVLEGLKDAGFLVDEIKTDIDSNFMPWLMSEVKTELAKMISSRDILGGNCRRHFKPQRKENLINFLNLI